MKISRYFFCLLFLPLFTILIDGCSVYGYKYGRELDSQVDETEFMSYENFTLPEIGDGVIIKLTNGRFLKGRYSGISEVESEGYPTRYAEMRDINSSIISLPAIGDTISIFIKPAKSKESKDRIFTGFKFKTLEAVSETTLTSRHISDSTSEDDDLKSVLSIIDKNGIETNGDELQSFIANQGMNQITAIVLEAQYGLDRIPLDEIDLIATKPVTNRAPLFAALGLVIDIPVFAVIGLFVVFMIQVIAGGF